MKICMRRFIKYLLCYGFIGRVKMYCGIGPYWQIEETIKDLGKIIINTLLRWTTVGHRKAFYGRWPLKND